MKNTFSDQKTSQRKRNEAAQRQSAGPDGASVAPPNRTGLPDTLKTGIESLSGLSLNDVRVHYNSPKPATLDALAYAQGTDIHVAPGQERHLPHEAWHVVQQKQRRVKPTMQMKGGVPVNDDGGLEHEADVMGAKALQQNNDSVPQSAPIQARKPTVQRMRARLGRPLTPAETATATAQGIANSQRVAGHGRAAHGRRREVPAARQQRQAAADRQRAIQQAIQLKMRQDVRSNQRAQPEKQGVT